MQANGGETLGTPIEIQVPPPRQGDEEQTSPVAAMFRRVSHRMPVNPGGQVHLNVRPSLVLQMPELAHGFVEQGSTSKSKPGLQKLNLKFHKPEFKLKLRKN